MDRFGKKTQGMINSLDLKHPRVRLLYWMLFAFTLLFSLICLIPPLWVLSSSIKDVKEFFAVPPTIIPRSFHPEKLLEVWNKLNFWKYYLNSFCVIIGGVICAILFNGLLAYGISRLKPKGSSVVFTLVLWSLMLPTTVGMVPLFKNISDLKLTNSYLPLWLMSGASAFFVILFKGFYDGIPDSLIEAAKLDGCTNISVFWHIILPLSKAVNMVVIILTINSMWSEFLWSYLILRKQELFTVMVKIYQMTSTYGGFSMDEQMVALTFAIIPPAILFVFFQKYILQGIAFNGIKG